MQPKIIQLISHNDALFGLDAAGQLYILDSSGGGNYRWEKLSVQPYPDHAGPGKGSTDLQGRVQL